jgi:hypothetical protein
MDLMACDPCGAAAVSLAALLADGHPGIPDQISSMGGSASGEVPPIYKPGFPI